MRKRVEDLQPMRLKDVERTLLECSLLALIADEKQNRTGYAVSHGGNGHLGKPALIFLLDDFRTERLSQKFSILLQTISEKEDHEVKV